jgi:hypothetical protein
MNRERVLINNEKMEARVHAAKVGALRFTLTAVLRSNQDKVNEPDKIRDAVKEPAIEDVLAVLRHAGVGMPVTTSEVSQMLDLSRARTITILSRLAIERRIRGKQVRNRGQWIWWLER